MKRDDSKAPATKGDLRLLEQKLRTATKADIDGLEQKLRTSTKGDLRKLETRLETRLEKKIEDKVEAAKQEIMGHFNFVAENMRYDWLGATHDQFESLKDRVSRLERKTGFAQAA